MGYQLPQARFVAHDANGRPLAGGKVWTYAAGTNNELPTFADADLTTENQNPVILDAHGRARIFVAAGVAYKIRVETSGGALVYDEDDIIAAPSVTVPPPAAGLPPGAFTGWGGNVAPAGWVLCDGAAYPRADPVYAALYAAIGTNWGAGNGTTTFNVPNLRGRFVLGVALSGTGSVIGQTGGAIDHVHTTPAHTHTIPAHTHNVPAHTHTIPRDGWGSNLETPPTTGRMRVGNAAGAGAENTGYQATADQQSGAASALVTTSTPLVTDSAGVGNTSQANPPFAAAHYIIKL